MIPSAMDCATRRNTTAKTPGISRYGLQGSPIIVTVQFWKILDELREPLVEVNQVFPLEECGTGPQWHRVQPAQAIPHRLRIDQPPLRPVSKCR